MGRNCYLTWTFGEGVVELGLEGLGGFRIGRLGWGEEIQGGFEWGY